MKDEKVIQIISENLNMDPSSITRDLDLATDLQADSLDFLTIGTELQDEFGIELDPTLFEEIKTVGDLIDYINNHAN